MITCEHSGFYYACWKLGIKQNDILERLNLQPNKDFGKWEKLKYDDNDNVLPKNVIQKKASDYIKPFITDPNFRAKYNLGENKAPTASNLRDAGHDDFIKFISSVGLTHNDVMRECNFDVNKDNDFWNKFRIDESGRPLSQEEKMHRFSQYFHQEIMMGVSDKYSLGENEAPTQEILEREGYGGFIHAIGREGILYNDLLKNSGYKPHDIDEFQKIGDDFHYVAKRITLEHCRANGVKGFSEVMVNSMNLNRPDISIPLDKKASRLSPELLEIHGNTDIKMVLAEFYLGNSQDNAFVHSTRGYQSDKRLLILVPTHLQGTQEPPQDILFRSNVRMMGPKEFSKFVGFQEGRTKEFLQAVGLAKDALYKEGDYREQLANAARTCKKIINDRFPEVSKDFRRYVADHPEIPLDIFDDKVDKSHLESTAREAKGPVLDGNGTPQITCEKKDVQIPEHLQENMLQARDAERKGHVLDEVHREETPAETRAHEEKAFSRHMNDEDTKIIDTKERV